MSCVLSAITNFLGEVPQIFKNSKTSTIKQNPYCSTTYESSFLTSPKLRTHLSHDMSHSKSEYSFMISVPLDSELEACAAYNSEKPWKGTVKQIITYRQYASKYTNTMTTNQVHSDVVVHILKTGTFRRGTDLASGTVIVRTPCGKTLRQSSGLFIENRCDDIDLHSFIHNLE